MNSIETSHFHSDPASTEQPRRRRKKAGGGWQAVWVAVASVSALVSLVRFIDAVKKKPSAPSVALSTGLRGSGPDDTPSGPQAFPADASKEAPFTNSLGMKFVPVPGASATATVLFCVHETRNADYAPFYAQARGEVANDWKVINRDDDGDPFVRDKNGEKADPGAYPVVMVSWREATAFCKWLSRKEGRHYRLPTDREWSVAVGIPEEPAGEPEKVRDAIKDKYPWGTSFDMKSMQGNLNDQSAKERFPDFRSIEGYRDCYSTTAPVMSFPPNVHGIYDLAGNVAEWCRDHDVPGGNYRIYRGSSWITFGREGMLSSYRNSANPGAYRGGGSLGFRIVLADSPAE